MLSKSLLILIGAALSLAAQQPPVGPQSGMPNLTRDAKGTIYLSWIDTTADGHALRFSTFSNQQWSPAETITEGKGWFANWADFPALTALPDGTLQAHWLTRFPQGGSHGYGIRIATKAPKGTWQQTHSIALDQKDDYAGFLTFLPQSSSAIYLAPSAAHPGEHHKTARFLRLSADGKPVEDLELDGDTCSCCQTAIAATSKGLVALFRDHEPGVEIRDISVVRERGGKWSKSVPIHKDGWNINGCPVEGPTIDAKGEQVIAAWLTRAQDQPRIMFTTSKDAGDTFAPARRIDEGKAYGRPTVTPLANGDHALLWLEKKTQETISLRLRRILASGEPAGDSIEVTTAPLGRAVGFPRLIANGTHALVVWRETGLKVKLIPLQELR